MPHDVTKSDAFFLPQDLPDHRIFVEWGEEAMVSSLDREFSRLVKEYTELYGRPTKVEFRMADEGWVSR